MEYIYDLIIPFLENKEPYHYLVILWLFSLLSGFSFGFFLSYLKRVFIISSR